MNLSNDLRGKLARCAEKTLESCIQKSPRCPVFVVGAPRSGTTVFSQCYIHFFKAAYLSNLAMSWPSAPLLGSFLTRLGRTSSYSDFQSDHGRTKHWLGPHEGWPLWNRWLSTGHSGDYLERGQVLPENIQAIQDFIGKSQTIFGSHFVSKNVKHSVRMLALNEAFPDCLFIILRRSVLANAKSLYCAWERFAPSPDKWWSVKPSNYCDYEHAPNHWRACNQLFYVYENIQRDSSQIGANRCLEVAYEEFCIDPRASLLSVAKFLASHGVEFQEADGVPESFPISNGIKLPSHELRRLVSALKEIYGASFAHADR